MKATGCYSFTDRNQQKPDIALDFFNLACFCTLLPCIFMFTSCVYVTFSKMYALFIFLPKPLYCASIISLLTFICKYCKYIDIYMNVTCIPICIY